MKQKISLTLSDDVLKEVDSMVDGNMIMNRSHAVEVLIKKALEQGMITQALILAGGKGTKFRPFTYEIPKTMIPIAGKPILEHIINRLKSIGVKNILLSVSYKAEKIISYFGDGSNFGVKIDYIIENEPLGTAGPIILAKNRLDNTFLMLNGDIVANIDYDDVVKFHRSSAAKFTMVLAQVDDPTKYGIAEMKGNKIIGFTAKPTKDDKQSRLVNAGIYVLSKTILDYIKSDFQMIENIFPEIAKESLLSGYIHPGYWVDIGSIESYEKVQKDLQEGKLNWLS